jgi:hypothetical protein
VRLIDADALMKSLKATCEICNEKKNGWCEHCCPQNDFEYLIDEAETVVRTDRPAVILNDQAIYITQGHIDALLKYEHDVEMREIIERIMKGNSDEQK